MGRRERSEKIPNMHDTQLERQQPAGVPWIGLPRSNATATIVAFLAALVEMLLVIDCLEAGKGHGTAIVLVIIEGLDLSVGIDISIVCLGQMHIPNVNTRVMRTW
jgi:hypothetical protein